MARLDSRVGAEGSPLRHSGQAKREPESSVRVFTHPPLLLPSKFVEDEHKDYDENDI